MSDAGTVTATLKLNATDFVNGIKTSSTALDRFAKSIMKLGSMRDTESAFSTLASYIKKVDTALTQLNADSKAFSNFEKMSVGVKRLAESLVMLSESSMKAETGMNIINTMIETYGSMLSGTVVNVKGVVTANNQLGSSSTSASQRTAQLQQSLANLRNSGDASASTLLRMARAIQQGNSNIINFANSLTRVEVGTRTIEQLSLTMQVFGTNLKNISTNLNGVTLKFSQLGATFRSFPSYFASMISSFNMLNGLTQTTSSSLGKFTPTVRNNTTSLNQMSTATASLNSNLLTLNGEINTTSNSTEKLNASAKKLEATEMEVANATRQTGTAMNSISSSAQRGSASMNQMATTSTKLGQALYSLMRVGRLVAIMFGYQIAYQFLHATTETVNARSEMENYARMLNWSTEEQDGFNKSLDETVAKFQRVNKYSLGETTMSIGVEFDLTPSQMAKANPIIAMITSEYMRAGRTPEEASLAVKDILQGEFTRLSRETGVGEEELIEAGWSGDVKDIDSLLSALEKVGTSRHWDQFAEKAHSLNDAITILQNRFGEWSAEMVNAVQPAIVNAFNSIMSFAGGLSEALGSVWKWLAGDSWEATATKIGLFAGAVVTAVHSLTAWRTGATMVQVANMGLKNSIMGLVLGIKAEEMANLGVANSISAKILGLNAEKVAEVGLTGATNQAIFTRGLEKTTTEAQTAISSLREGTLVGEATAIALVKDEETGAIVVKQGLSLATGENTTTTIGFTGALGMMIAGEQLAEGETLSLAGTLGALTGAFLTSPIGWFTMAVLALASAFFVLSGGLDDSWDKMKKFNEIMDNAGEEQKKAEQYLADLEQRVGSTSMEYEFATISVRNWKKELQSASLQMQVTQKQFEDLELAMSTKSKPILKKYGLSDEEIEKFDGGLSALALGKDKYYKASQVLNKQIYDEDSNFVKDMDKYLATVDKLGWDKAEASERLSQHYLDKAQQSYIANTTDDWWEWMWNDLYAGINDMWIQWDLFVADFWSRVQDVGLGQAIWDTLVDQLWNWDAGDFASLGLDGVVQSISDGITNFDWGKFGSDLSKNLAHLIFGKKSSDDFLKEMDNWFRNLFKNQFGIGGDNALPIGDWFNNWFKGVDEWWAGLPAWLDSQLVNVEKAINTELKKLWSNVTKNWDNFWKEHPLIDEEGVKSFFGDIDTLKGYLSDIWGSITEFFDSGIFGDWNDAMDIIKEQIMGFLSTVWTAITDFINNPQGFMDSAQADISTWFSNMFANASESVTTFVNDNIVTPFKDALTNSILGIPFGETILQMLGLADTAVYDAEGKGVSIGQALQNGLENIIKSIPLLSDILSALQQITSAFSEGYSKGNTLGEKIKNGLKAGIDKIGEMIVQEFKDGINGIAGLFGEAWNTAKGYGEQLWNGVNSILKRESPGFIHDQIVAEFGTDIPSAIDESGATAFASAQSYGQQVVNGVSGMYANMPQVAMDFFSNGALSEYQTDANTVTTLSDDLSLTTTDAFSTMQSGVNTSVTGMATDVLNSYTSMQQNQNTMMTNMQTANLNGYRQMQLQTNQQLLTMRNETQNVTTQMIQAWSHMKTQLVATADALKSESTSHFNTLSSTIGSFYRKIQNPANWGAGHGSGNVRTARNPTVGKSFAKGIKTRSGSAKHYAGGDYYTGRQTMTLRTLKNLMCPNGDCGDIFDGMDLNKTVDVNEFLASVGLGHGFGTWGSWKGTHYNYIKDRSDQWNMKSPQLLGRINTDANFKVGDFENGTPKISFASFQSMAESLFSAIPYKFYYDSSWKGSWLGAIQAGACNCYDGASALIAFANTCGFSGSMAHGTWNGIPHVWAVIEGRKMDTTGWQQRGTWTPSASAGGLRSTRYAGGESKTYNITIEIDTVYGEDDFENKIRESAQKVMREEFNDPYTIPI